MKKIILKISYNCDNNCLFCHAEDYKNIRNIQEKIILHKIKHIKDNYPEIWQILFSWWEPTINANIKKYLDFAKKLWFKVWLITNGGQLNNEFYDINIESWSLDYIYLSLHWPNSEIHNEIAWNKLSFQNVDKFLKKSWKYKNLDIVVNCVVNKLNFDSLNQIAEYISKYSNIKILKFSLLEPKWNWLNNIDNLYVPIDLIANKIQSIISKYNSINICWDWFCLCVMDWFHDKISNLQTEGIEYMSETFESKIFKTDFSNREYSLKCENCTKKEICPWIYKSYISRYWDYYLKPYKC